MKQGEAKSFSLSPKAQMLWLFGVILLIQWGIFTSFFFFSLNKNVQTKEQKVMNVSSSYASLLAQVEVYKERLDDLQQKYDENQQLALSLLKEKDVDVFTKNKKARQFLSEADKFKDEMALMRKKIASLASVLEIHDKQSPAYESEKLLYERDKALKEVDKLRHELKQTQELVIDIQNSQKKTLDQMDSLLGKSVSKVEGNLKGVEKVLKKAGVQVSRLAKRLSENDENGQGGPFIPENSSYLVSQENTNKLSSLYEEMTYFNAFLKVQEMLPLGNPLQGKTRVTCAFGHRKDPFTGRRARHEGIDISSKIDTKIAVQADGKVLRAWPNGAYGNFVEIQHKLGFRTRYGHLKKILVKKGQVVKKGDIIGIMGNTGRSTGPHLHYEIRVNRKVINPYRFIRTKRIDKKGNIENG